MREGFTETFKPLIETFEAVKTSIDTQQNKLIKQLQDNQLALTEGPNKNRLAITSGFDKMDEVKKSDLLQLPGYEAIEHPEMEEVEEEEELEEKEEETKKDIIEKMKEIQNLVIKKMIFLKTCLKNQKKNLKMETMMKQLNFLIKIKNKMKGLKFYEEK